MKYKGKRTSRESTFILFLILSAGNNYNYDIQDYPNYLTEGTEETKIIDLASAALAITVEAIAH